MSQAICWIDHWHYFGTSKVVVLSEYKAVKESVDKRRLLPKCQCMLFGLVSDSLLRTSHPWPDHRLMTIIARLALTSNKNKIYFHLIVWNTYLMLIYVNTLTEIGWRPNLPVGPQTEIYSLPWLSQKWLWLFSVQGMFLNLHCNRLRFTFESYIITWYLLSMKWRSSPVVLNYSSSVTSVSIPHI